MIKRTKDHPKYLSLKLLTIISLIIALFLIFVTVGRKIVFQRVIVGQSNPIGIRKNLKRNEKGKWEFLVSLKNDGWKEIEISGFVRKDSNNIDTLLFNLSGEQRKILKTPMLNINPLISIEMKKAFRGKLINKERLNLSPHYMSPYDTIFGRLPTIFDLDCCMPYYSRNMALEWIDWLDFYRSLPSSISYIDDASLSQLFPSRLEKKRPFFREQTELKLFVGFPDALFERLKKDTIHLKFSLIRQEGKNKRKTEIEKIKYKDKIFYYDESCTLDINKGNIDSLSLIFSLPHSRLFSSKNYFLAPLEIELPYYNDKRISISYDRWITLPPRFPFVPKFLELLKGKICYFI